MNKKITMVFLTVFLTSGCSNFPKGPNLNAPTADWKTFSYKDFRISLDSPYPLSQEVGPQNINGIKRHMALETSALPWESKSCRVMVMSFLLDRKTGLPPPPKVFADMSVRGMKEKGIVLKDVQSQTTSTLCSGFGGVYTSGTFKGLSLIPMRFVFITVEDHYWLWQVCVIYLDHDEDVENMAQRVLKSIKITR